MATSASVPLDTHLCSQTTFAFLHINTHPYTPFLVLKNSHGLADGGLTKLTPFIPDRKRGLARPTMHGKDPPSPCSSIESQRCITNPACSFRRCAFWIRPPIQLQFEFSGRGSSETLNHLLRFRVRSSFTITTLKMKGLLMGSACWDQDWGLNDVREIRNLQGTNATVIMFLGYVNVFILLCVS